MNNYAMLFEELTETPWGGHGRRSDPFRLADADTFRAVDNDLADGNGENAKFALYAAITKVVADNIDNGPLVESLRGLRVQVTEARTLNDLCKAIDATKALFVTAGYVIIN